MIDKHKIRGIVEYIRQFDFASEVREVVEDLNKVLSHFGLTEIDLSYEEEELLINELIPLAEQYEFHEAQYLAFQDELFFEQQQAAIF